MEKTLEEEHPDYIFLSSNLGGLYTKMKAYDKSLDLHLKTKRWIVKSLSTSNPQHFNILNQMATLFIARKEYDKAWKVCFEHIRYNSVQDSVPQTINEEWGKELANYNYHSYKEMIRLLTSIYNLLDTEKSIENLRKQRVVSVLGIELLEKSRNTFVSDEDKLRLLSSSADWTENMIGALSGLDKEADWEKCQKEAFRYAELNKSVLLANSIQAERAYTFGGLPDSLIQQEKDL